MASIGSRQIGSKLDPVVADAFEILRARLGRVHLESRERRR